MSLQNFFKSLIPERSTKPRRHGDRTHRQIFSDSRWRTVGLELLEQRAMLSVATDLVSQLTPYETNLNSSLDAATSLPLVGHQLANLQEFNTIFQNSLPSIEAQTQGMATGHHQLSIPLPALDKTFTFELGLDALFAEVSATGGVRAAINPTLVVGFDYQNGSATLNALQSSLDIGFDLSLPTFQASMSLNHLLFTKAVDAGTDFQGHLRFDLSAGAALTPHFSGEAHVLMGLSLSFVDPALNASFNPKFRTTLDLDWAINPATNQMLAPSIALVDFGLDVESFMHGFLGDVVTTVQKFTKPIQPFVDIFQTPVPIISAFGSDETIGTLMLKGAGSSKGQQDSFTLMMQIIDAVNAIDLSGDTGGAVIPFGTVRLTGNAQQAGAFSFDVGAVSGAIDDVFGSPALQGVENALQSLGNYAGTSSSSGFKFPLLEDPGRVIVGMLTGQVETMFSFSTGRQHFVLAPSIGVGIPGVFGIFLNAGVIFDANLTMGYDTAGLNAFAADPGHPEHLLHGFYFDNSIDTSVPPIPNLGPVRQSGLYLQGLMEVQADLFLAHVSGGLYANVSVELANTDPSPHVHLDTMLANLAGGGRVFKLAGKVYASADLSLELSLPVGPDITLFSFNLGYAELLNFDPPPPPVMSPPPVIHDVADQHTLLLDALKMGAGTRVVTVQPFHDLSINDNGAIYLGDGIRVDYQGETHLYIERKDDFHRDFYNMIAIDGTAPDGVTINVIDPFRVFADEGAVNPYPAQTKPTVMLVGGKDVNYTYREAADGTHPIVFLAGGYGLNTLIGGTMEFGNFIPSSRVAQAHAHFANRSGFDGTGQNQINAQIANAVPPSTPDGITGATMYASHGGLMMGGPGNNSFYAMGAGVYEMVGGSWINTFSMSPSYGGAPATYQIDGGGGESGLVVRVPSDENVVFQNSTVVDKYHPAAKALDVLANAGLSATAHGIQKVHIVAAAGSSIELGDTSEVDIQFSIQGAANLKFGGSAAPDIFDIYTEADFIAKKNHYAVQTYMPYDATTIYVPAPTGYSFEFFGRYPDPIHYVTRTFGTNNKTQIVPFAVSDADASSIVLDGKGASDSYEIDIGVGSFIDVRVEDSDATTQNSLTVNFNQALLAPAKLTLTDNQVQFEYYTIGLLLGQLFRRIGGSDWYYIPDIFNSEARSYWTSSVFYTPTVTFGSNIDIELVATSPFYQTIVNRPLAPQTATIRYNAFLVSTVPYYAAGTAISPPYVYDLGSPNPSLLIFNSLDNTFNVQANAGNLAIQNAEWYGNPTTFNVHSNTGTLSFSETQKWGGWIDTYNVFGNAGTLNISYLINDTYGVSGYVVGLGHVVNVQANSGIINLHDVLSPWLINYGIDTQVNIGSGGSLANVHGRINLSNLNGHYGLTIDDRNGSASRAWSIDYTQTQIGDLTLNYAGGNAPAPYLDIFSRYQAYPNAGSSATLGSNPPFYYLEINGSSFPTWQLAAPSLLFNQDGNVVNVSLAVSGNPGGSVIYGASNLPPGLSINPTTGVISGTIPEQAYRAFPYETTVRASADGITRLRSIAWYVSSAIEISVPIFGAFLGHEGMAASLGPISTTNGYNRPVTLTATGLPPGLSFDSATATIDGIIGVGAAQNAPYHVTVHATDGSESAVYEFDWDVTGITLVGPSLRIDHVGDSVNLAIQGTTASGAALVFTADGLPDGLSIDSTTGLISGVVASQPQASSFYVSLTATQGNDVASTYFRWSVVPVGLSDVVTIFNPGTQTHREEEYAYSNLYATSSLGLPLSWSVQGLPSGISLFTGEGEYLYGQIAVGAASASPYHVTLTATDGIWSDEVTFDWIVSPAGTVDVYYPGSPTSLVYDNVVFGMYATSSLGETLTYSAAGLPPGLSIDAQTGIISGAVSPLSALPSVFQVSVSATSASDSDQTTFLWNVLSSYQPNVISLPHPTGVGVIDVMSPIGTMLTASISPNAGVSLPGGIDFPFGFVTFTVSGLAPGAAADVTIVGLDPTDITDYYKYGTTPANPTSHWYNFLFAQQTDGDNASLTGMEIVGGHIVLHLVDGGRGDDDVALNGVIFDIGGPATVSDTPVNHAPAAIDDSSSMTEDTTSVSDDVLSNDTDVDDDTTLTVSGPGTFSGTYGTLTLNSNGSYIYTLDTAGVQHLAQGASVVESFRYQASDGQASSNIATLVISITGVNDAPQVSPVSVTTTEDTSAAVTLVASDVENNPLTYVIVGSPQHGTLSGTAPNLTYTPAANYFGADSFTYRVNDGALDSNLATVSITVTSVNDAPQVSPVSVTATEDTSAAVTLVASDVENNPLTYVIVGSPQHGTLSGTAPNLTYSPAANYNGADSFTYRVNDGALDSNLATVTITVTAVNDAPQASPASVTTAEDTAVGITLVGSDVENNPLSYAIVNVPQHGTLSGTAPNLTYSPAANYNGADSFTYRVSDGSLDSNLATVSIAVTAVNDSPAANSQAVSTNQDTTLSGMLHGVDGDPEVSQTLTYAIVSGPSHGSLSLNPATGEFTYQPAANYSGPDSFTFTVTDDATAGLPASLVSAAATVTIDVVPTTSGVVAGAKVINGVLKIVGTQNADLVGITRLFNQIIVAANFLSGGLRLFSAGSVDRIDVRLRDGNDLLIVAGNVGVPAILDGGDGDDLIYGGGGISVILGGLGNDLLVGGPGRNVIIGGKGSDTLMGGDASDLLIAGTTAYDSDDTALQAILKEWTSSRSYTDRVANLRGGLGPVLSPSGTELKKGVTVFDDTDVDELLGGAELDWLMYDLSRDHARDKKSSEAAN